MTRYFLIIAAAMALWGVSAVDASGCTGISLSAKDGSRVVARTVDWAAEPMESGLVVVPRGHWHRVFTSSGDYGLEFKSIYGYVGIYAEYEPFIIEGVNESGLSAGLFFYPGHEDLLCEEPEDSQHTLTDMQFVSWVLARFSSIEQVKKGLKEVDLVSLDHRIGSVHWRIAEPSGRMVVVEVVDGVPVFYENPVGVLANSPDFPWHLKNLNNYINIAPGNAPDATLNNKLRLRSLGQGSGMLGLPGDFTSPSRFVQAAFFSSTAPMGNTGFDAVTQAFHILNQFDIPIGAQHQESMVPEGLPSATQFTVAIDQKGMKLYYRTAWNMNIRCVELKGIDFKNCKYQIRPLDQSRVQPVEILKWHNS